MKDLPLVCALHGAVGSPPCAGIASYRQLSPQHRSLSFCAYRHTRCRTDQNPGPRPGKLGKAGNSELF